MPERTTIRITSLAGGVSKQPPHLRYPGQTGPASNVVARVQDGVSKRSGSRFFAKVTGLTAAGAYRLHAIERDNSERYVCAYGPVAGVTTLKVYDANGTLATVNISADAQTYLNAGSPTADQLRFTTVADTTFIVNTQATPALSTSASYVATTTARNADALFATQPANGSYCRTEEDTVVYPKGHWLYNATNTDTTPAVYAKWTFAAGNWGAYGTASGWTGSTINPQGAQFSLRRKNLNLTGCTYTNSIKTITKTGAFTGMSFTPGEKVRVTGGTNITAGWYPIASMTANTIVLASVTATGDNTNTALDGIGVQADILLDFQTKPPATFEDVAVAYTKALRDAGFVNALCSFVREGVSSWRATVTSGWAGTDSLWYATAAPATGWNLTTANYPFNGGSSTAGTGTADTSLNASGSTSPEKRWTRVPGPAQTNATPTATTMPVKMVRTSVGPPAVFTVSTIDWNSRLSGDDQTNPAPKLLTTGTKIADVCFHKNRLGLFGGEYVVFGVADDLYNFYAGSESIVADDDPVELSLSSERVTAIESVLPVRNAVLILTKAGKQFEFTAREAVTPSSGAVTPTTAKRTHATRAVSSDGLVHFAGPGNAGSILWEYGYDDQQAQSSAIDATAHVEGLIGSTVLAVASAPSRQSVLVLDSAGLVHLYRYFFRNGGKEQGAWSSWSFDASYRLSGLCVVNDEAYLLVESQSQFVIERVAIDPEQTADSGFPYAVRLDRRMTLTGVHSAGTTTWTLPLDDAGVGRLSDTTINAIVLGTGTATGGTTGSAGDVLTPTTAGGTTVTKTGNYSGAAAVLGRTFASTVQLSRPFVRDQNGLSLQSGRLTHIRQHLRLHNTGAVTLTASKAGSADRTKSFTPPSGTTVSTAAALQAHHGGDADQTTLTLSGSGAKPWSVAGVEYLADYQPRSD